jgi:hypothetical protein
LYIILICFYICIVFFVVLPTQSFRPSTPLCERLYTSYNKCLCCTNNTGNHASNYYYYYAAPEIDLGCGKRQRGLRLLPLDRRVTQCPPKPPRSGGLAAGCRAGVFRLARGRGARRGSKGGIRGGERCFQLLRGVLAIARADGHHGVVSTKGDTPRATTPTHQPRPLWIVRFPVSQKCLAG